MLFAALPKDVPGFGRLEQRRAELARLVADPRLIAAVARPDVLGALGRLPLRREAAPAAGLNFIRRARAGGTDYFLVNVGAARFDGWLELATPAKAALLMNPLDGASGAAALRRGTRGGTQVYLQLAPGESAVVRLGVARGRGIPDWRYVASAGEATSLGGAWGLSFLTGGPELPAAATLEPVASWTTIADPRVLAFSGTARYRLEFDAPTAAADEWLLDLGDVRESARVRLNGAEVATAWSLPFTVRLGAALKPRGNVLEIDVTNLPANRVRDLDNRKVEWKIMRDINLASLRYRALDASRWEVAPSGLNGPVRLVPLRVIKPR